MAASFDQKVPCFRSSLQQYADNRFTVVGDSGDEVLIHHLLRVRLVFHVLDEIQQARSCLGPAADDRPL
jgi:hypothetical protein